MSLGVSRPSKSQVKSRTSWLRKRKGPPSLTDDAVAEILARLPAICIGRFRAVCKAWNALASHPSVDRVLAARRPTVTAIIKERDTTLWWLDDDDPRRHRVDAARIDRFRGRWHPDVHRTPPSPLAISLDDDDVAISTEAFRSWDGVLCTHVLPRRPDDSGNAGYMLWNPPTNACAVVAAAGHGRIVGGYAHPVTGRFHLLHGTDVAVPSDNLAARTTVRILRVGDVTGWREVSLPPSLSTMTMSGEKDRSVSLHGNLHWLVNPGSGKKAAAAALLVFDTVREKFRFMAAPESPGLDPTTARLRVVPGGNKQQLCVLALTKQKQPAVALEVWVLDDYSSEPRRSWRLRETIGLDGTRLLRTTFVAAAAVEVVEGVNEGEEVFVHLEDGIEAYSVRSKVWRRVSAIQPEISFGKALRGFHRGVRISSNRLRGVAIAIALALKIKVTVAVIIVAAFR
ncbi:hypothetical protein HU200_018091 [Digitaria exilis]|uniref:F-box domain-containing protein n=1 Tax=Digitaria exilis TaxID=1010633 RepID=A0A835F5D8_9POAL|nr:hypothetical protein HU200_018091 [Digitaria exilis]